MTHQFPKTDRVDAGAPYWSALEKGQLLFQRCTHCGRNQLPARHECVDCQSGDLVWAQAKGRAKLVGWVDFHRDTDPCSRNLAIVELDEGPRLVTTVLTDSPESMAAHHAKAFRPARRFGQAITSFLPL